MTKQVKSPVWAIVLLLICLILRFCDSWLFGDANTKRNFPHYQRFRPSHYRRIEPGVTHDEMEGRAAAADSMTSEFYFFQ